MKMKQKKWVKKINGKLKLILVNRLVTCYDQITMKYLLQVWFDVKIMTNDLCSDIFTDDDKTFLIDELNKKVDFRHDEEIQWLPPPIWSLKNSTLIASIEFNNIDADSANQIADIASLYLEEQFNKGCGENGFSGDYNTIFVESPKDIEHASLTELND